MDALHLCVCAATDGDSHRSPFAENWSVIKSKHRAKLDFERLKKSVRLRLIPVLHQKNSFLVKITFLGIAVGFGATIP